MTDAEEWRGRDLVDRHGEKVGTVEELYVDQRTPTIARDTTAECIPPTRETRTTTGGLLTVRPEERAAADPAGGHGVAHQVTNVAAIVSPFAAFVLAAVMLWGRLVDWIDLAVLAVAYAATGLGITVGFHRLLTHRSFQTYPAVRHALAVLGTLAVEGSVIKWVADHRKHHAFADQDGDPHTPHGAGPGVLGGLSGLWHAHVGWLFNSVGQADQRRYAPDLLKDHGLRRIDAAEKQLILASLAIPFVVGFLVKGTFTGALVTLVWGALVRVFLLHHATFSINSICHFFGRRRFATKDQSTNVAWLSLVTLGESWHNNHHAFPTSAFHGLRRRELDLGGLFITALERVGLAWRVVRVSPERQRQKAAPRVG
jgi:stearoyl-CoA desaturase (delta-9 desaturase)